MVTYPIKVAFIASLALAAQTAVSHAATVRDPGQARTAAQITVTARAAGAGSTVHYLDGQRYDVPSNLLRAPGVLINGLSPQPVQFD